MRLRRFPSIRTVAVFDIFLVLGVLGVNLKTAMLDGVLGPMLYAGKPRHYQYPAADFLGFLASDVLLNFLVIPLVATLLISLVFRRHRVLVAALATSFFVVLYFYQLRALHEVGQFVSLDLMADSVRWAIANPATGSEYMTPLSILKLCILFGSIIAIAVLARGAHRHEGRQGGQRALSGGMLLRAAALLACAFAVVVGIVGVLHYPEQSSAARTALGNVARAMFARPAIAEADLATTVDGLLDRARTFSRTPAFDAGSRYVGSERDADVILFVMETGPAQLLDLPKDGAALPGAGSLFPHSFVARQHYTTYPYSADAVFSIESGIYPQGRRRLLRTPQVESVNGLMTALRDVAPLRSVYLPSVFRAEVDDRMYTVLGAQNVYEADRNPDDPLRHVAEQRADALMQKFRSAGANWIGESEGLLRRRLVQDLQSLEKMKQDIATAIRANHRYCVMYLPQVAHGPWIALRGDTTARDRGHDLMVLEDSWLKELVDVVRDSGRLDRTVIVLTADHGVRAQQEDPDFVVGKISDYMFHMPLLIHAPGALAQTQYIDAPTSHIDLAPTVLALLGRTAPLERMLGIPVWQRGADERLYFYASAYAGADGYLDNGRFYMRQTASDASFASSTFTFGEHDLVPADSPVAAEIGQVVKASNELNEAITNRLAEDSRACAADPRQCAPLAPSPQPMR